MGGLSEVIPAGEIKAPTGKKEGVTILHRDGKEDDRIALQVLFNGGTVLDIKSGMLITAGSIADLPPGIYRTCPA